VLKKYLCNFKVINVIYSSSISRAYLYSSDAYRFLRPVWQVWWKETHFHFVQLHLGGEDQNYSIM